MNEEMNTVTDVAENLEEIQDVATNDSNLKKIAIGAGAAILISGAAYGVAKLVKKGVAAVKRRKLRKEAEDAIEDDFDDFESYEEQVQSIHEND